MIVPRRAVQLHRLLAVEQDLKAARELFYPLVPLIRLEFRASSSPDNDPHWLAVTRESALLRQIPVGQSRRPLSAISRQHAEQLKELLVALGEIEGAGPERAAAGSHSQQVGR
jgi:dihydrodipicolinate synthase/N-acetylneuraminate lyase